MTHKTNLVLTASNDPSAPICLRFTSRIANEDGVRAGMEQDLSPDEARNLAKDLQQAAIWVESGAWKAGGP